MSDPFATSRCKDCGFVHYPQHSCPIEDLQHRVDDFGDRLERIWAEWEKRRADLESVGE